jgi:hypothetical protein
MKNVATFLLTLAAFMLWMYGQTSVAFSVELSEAAQIHATNVWMACDAVAKCLVIVSLVIWTDGYLREWLLFMLGLTLNNAMDEFFFDPLSIGINEYILLVFLAIYYSQRITKNLYAPTR